MDINYCNGCEIKVSMYNGSWNWCNDNRKHVSNVKKCNRVSGENRDRQKEP